MTGKRTLFAQLLLLRLRCGVRVRKVDSHELLKNKFTAA